MAILSRDDSALCRNKQKVYFVLTKLSIPNNTIILKMKVSKESSNEAPSFQQDHMQTGDEHYLRNHVIRIVSLSGVCDIGKVYGK